MKRAGVMFGVGAIATLALAGAAFAQTSSNSQSTPTNFNYVIKDGKRVPKPETRVVNADGSWREETRQGNCTEIKEGKPDGSVKTTRKCN